MIEERPELRRAERARPAPRVLGVAMPRGYGARPRLGPEAAAAFATYVDPARARAAIEGRTLVYTVRWNSPGGPALAGPDVH